MSEQRHRPLDGIRVISFGAFVAGNTAGCLLAELGADVVKVEPRARPEVLRTPAYAIGPTFTEPSGVPQTIMYGTLSRGTRSLSMDLRTEAARPAFHELARRADVVVENVGGASLARWGCSFEDLVVDNPRLVWLSLSGYGRTGPAARYLAYAANISGYVGLTSLWGHAAGTLSDYVTAATGVVGTIAALAQVERTGAAVYVDAAQIDAMTQLMAPELLDPLVNGCDPPYEVNHVPGSWLSGAFPALGVDAWVAIEIEDAEDWSVLCHLLGRSDLETVDEAVAAGCRKEIETALVAWLAERSPHSATHLLQKAGLAAGAVQDAEDVWRDPQLRSRGFMVERYQPDYGVLQYPNSVQRLSRTAGHLDRAGPRLGQHTYEIMREWAGTGDAELEALTASGAIFQAAEQPRG